MKRVLFATVVLLAGLLLSSCTSDDKEVLLRIFHGSPDADALDVFVNNRTFVQAIPFLFASDYDNADSGNVDIEVAAEGTDFDIFDQEFDLSGSDNFTLFISGFLSSATGLLVADEREQPEEGVSRLRFIHLAPSGAEVDVYITPSSDSTALIDLEPTLEDVAFREVEGYINLEPGDYVVRLTFAGTRVVVLNRQITLGDRKVHTALAVDAVGGGTPLGLSFLDDTND